MKQNLDIYRIKSFGLELKDLDTGSRMVSGYLSAFNVEDSDKDIILPGAFKQSINMRGPKAADRIAYIRQHDWSRQIGKFVELEEDTYGLRFVAELGRSDEGRNAMLDYQDGILREHSIGFNYVPTSIEYNEEDDVYYISQLKLWEGSAVTLGANAFARVSDVAKSQGAPSAFVKLSEEMKAIQKALGKGKGTDSRLQNLEMRLSVLNSKLHTLFDSIQSDSKEAIAIEKGKEESKKEAKMPSFISELISYQSNG